MNMKTARWLLTLVAVSLCAAPAAAFPTFSVDFQGPTAFGPAVHGDPRLLWARPD